MFSLFGVSGLCLYEDNDPAGRSCRNRPTVFLHECNGFNIPDPSFQVIAKMLKESKKVSIVRQGLS